MSGSRVALYLAIPLVMWLSAVLGYTVAYGTPLTSTSFPNVIPAFTSPFLGGVIPAAGFLVFAWPAMHGNAHTGLAPLAATAIVAGCVAIWFYGGWSYGMRYQGRAVVYTLLVLNIALVAFLAFQANRLRSEPSLRGKFLFHAIFWVWIGWLAFPWLGEWP